jgi:hypothetical protein
VIFPVVLLLLSFWAFWRGACKIALARLAYYGRFRAGLGYQRLVTNDEVARDCLDDGTGHELTQSIDEGE